jgi:hypothetical protein
MQGELALQREGQAVPRRSRADFLPILAADPAPRRKNETLQGYAA